jgi:hypothetical protein
LSATGLYIVGLSPGFKDACQFSNRFEQTMASRK